VATLGGACIRKRRREAPWDETDILEPPHERISTYQLKTEKEITSIYTGTSSTLRIISH
jgi:hypothetical protein